MAGASEEASANVQSVAAATEELSSPVNEISRQVQASARIAGEAVQQVRQTNGRVAELSQASAEVLPSAQSLAGDSNRLKDEIGDFLEAVRAA